MLSPNAALILAILREHAESEYTANDGALWGHVVYLDNARQQACQQGMSASAFGGCLSALIRAELYCSQDGFSFVRLDDPLPGPLRNRIV